MNYLYIFFIFNIIFYPVLHGQGFTPIADLKRRNAVDAYQRNDLQEAKQIFESLLTDDPQDIQALYNLGKVSYAQQDFEKAEAYFNTVVELPESNDEQKKQAYFNCGNAQVKSKKLEEALKSYKNVLTIDPDHQEAQEMVRQIEKLLEQQKQQQQRDQEQQNKQQSNES